MANDKFLEMADIVQEFADLLKGLADGLPETQEEWKEVERICEAVTRTMIEAAPIFANLTEEAGRRLH